MVTSTSPTVPPKGTEKNQHHQSPQGTPLVERTGPCSDAAQPTTDQDHELSTSVGDDGICGSTCRQVVVTDQLPHNIGQILGTFTSSFMAWMCVLGTHLVVMNTWGVINSFGIFQSYYVDTLNQSPSEISWIGSVEIFLLFFIGAFAGRLTDAGFFRPLFLKGGVLVVGGALAVSASNQYWQIFLAQGVCVGHGNGCLFCPVVALVSTYFQRHRSLAMGLGACGSSTGGVLFPIMVRQLLPHIGFQRTIRTIALIQGVSLAISFLCLRPRIAPRKRGKLIESTAFKELEYCFWGTYLTFFYISTYSRDIQDISYISSLNLLLIVNGVGTVGRKLPNIIADRYGTLTIFIPRAAVSSLLMFAWIAVLSVDGLCVWAAICGIPIGGIQSMFPSALVTLTTDPRQQGTRIGMVFTVVSFGVLTGPPSEGGLISALGGRFIAAQLFAGASLLLVMLLLVATRETKRRKMGLGPL
ncbi:major facilitator superfamily domain-containing protein [Dactylonectria macrodidyma]|uniref:Major facilitator superfamily domain-containing protein n=1 Tax=Dactylonectria macrodidyma TaxID=307937 RepID=A0A9P9DV48_9HYPO|nr:major facilitator superfamily domain-containing protein [Dactylonectria macrodidyma]